MSGNYLMLCDRTVHHVNVVLALCEAAGEWRTAERLFGALKAAGAARARAY